MNHFDTAGTSAAKNNVAVVSWRTRWLIYEYVRNSMWIVPALLVAVAVTMGLTIPQLDQHTKVIIGIKFGPDAARAVLGAIAGGMITFTGFVFSILLLAVQFGSSQFSPRMLRRFLRDPTTKLALGLFMATFMYALTVLRIVGTGKNADFVPNNGVSASLLLLFLSMIVFLRLITRTTQGLRVAAVLKDLGRDARKLIDRSYPDRLTDDDDGREGEPPRPPGPCRTVMHAGAPGVLQSVNMTGLARRASEAGVVIELVPRIGDFVSEGTTLFRVYGEGSIDDAWLTRTVAVGDERTMNQDPAFAFRLLADISAKALSPGVNDPTTSTQALDQIELLLRLVGSRRLTLGIARDARGEVRFWFQRPTWEDYLSLALDETRQYGQGSVQVTRRLRALLEDLHEAVPERRRPAIDAEIELLDAAAVRSFVDSGDRVAAGADRQGLGATLFPGRSGPAPRPA